MFALVVHFKIITGSIGILNGRIVHSNEAVARYQFNTKLKYMCGANNMMLVNVWTRLMTALQLFNDRPKLNIFAKKGKRVVWGSVGFGQVCFLNNIGAWLAQNAHHFREASIHIQHFLQASMRNSFGSRYTLVWCTHDVCYRYNVHVP